MNMNKILHQTHSYDHLITLQNTVEEGLLKYPTGPLQRVSLYWSCGKYFK